MRGVGASTVSANWQVHDPDQATVVPEDRYLREDPAYYHGPTVPESQDAGLKVVSYTISDEATMQRVIDLGWMGSFSDDHELLILDFLLLVAVDGRRPGYGVGASFEEEAAIMDSLGAVEAVNLDGGGSTTMTLGQQLVIRPSDATGERRIGDAVIMLPE